MSVIDILKPHNQEAFQEICEKIESGITRIVAPRATGSGKTYLMGALAEKYNDEEKLVLEPTRPLLDSIKDKFDEFSIKNTDFITYQKLIRMSDEDIADMDYRLIFLDECHHGTAPVWGRKIDFLMASHPDSIVFGTSATTVRNDGVNVTESIFEGNAVSELPLSKAIARKVLPCPKYITAIYRLDDEFEKLKKRIEASTNTKEEKQEFYEKMKIMQAHFEKSYGIPTILNKYIKVKNSRYLVFCKNKKHLDAMREVVVDWFKTSGVKDVHSYAVYSDYPDKEKDYKDFQEDNSDSAKILFSINMLNEGLHIKDISGVLMLRTTLSNTIYLQQLGRLVEAENIGKYLLVFDFVNNFSSVNDGIGLLKEIKDAIAEEKESDPDFDDSGFENIDTFFVLENVIEIQEMFREIEGRLHGDWDVMFQEYCKFYEENGHGDVPKTEEYRKLSNWCQHQRCLKEEILKEDRKISLDENGFIWDVPKYRFEKNIKEISEYYFQYEKYPSQHSENLHIKKLGKFSMQEKMLIRNSSYPEWKIKIIQKYLPNFSCKTKGDQSFDEFIYYAKLYKEKYGHVNIKYRDVIADNYHIGAILETIKRKHRNGMLQKERKKQLEEFGIYLGGKFEKQFNENMKLAKCAADEGIRISRNNTNYENKDLYHWVFRNVKLKYLNNELADEDIEIIERLFGKSLYQLFHRGSLVKMVDVIEERNIGIYNSQREIVKEFKTKFDLKISSSAINLYLKGKVKTPYKGRFMFYYATDEEVKKYFEENKAN